MYASRFRHSPDSRFFGTHTTHARAHEPRQPSTPKPNSHAAAAGTKDPKAGSDSSNKRHRADSHGKLSDTAGAGTGSGSERNARGRRGGIRQRERDERKRERADSRDDSRDAISSSGGRSGGGGGRDPKPRGKEGGAGRGSGGRDSFAGGAGGPPFRDLENWDPEKALIRSLFLTDELDKVRLGEGGEGGDSAAF